MNSINQRIIEMKASFAEQMAQTEEDIKQLTHQLEDKREYLVKLRASVECLNLLIEQENEFYENSVPIYEPIEDTWSETPEPEVNEDGDIITPTEGGMSIQLGKNSAVKTLADIENLTAELEGTVIKPKVRPENIKSRYHTEVEYPGGATGIVEINEPAGVVYVDVKEGLYGVPTRVLDAQLARKWRAEGLTEEEIAARLPDVMDLKEVECP